MQKSFHLILFLGALSLISLEAKAQYDLGIKTYHTEEKTDFKSSLEDKAQKLTDALNDIVKLSEYQYTKAYQYNLTYLIKKEDALKKGKIGLKNTEKINKQIKAYLEQRDTQVFSILESNQAIIWKQWLSDNKIKKEEQLKRMEKINPTEVSKTQLMDADGYELNNDTNTNPNK